ncbi:MAG: type II toxin-antitoxin system HipA family toxin [bacterium]
MTIPSQLFVHHERGLVGVLRPWRFTYSEEWLSDERAWPISHSLPLREGAHDESAEHWFGNLLPEGGARERIAQRLRLGTDDDFALLAALGGECAGALTLGQDRQQLTTGAYGFYRRLGSEELEELARAPGGSASVLGEHTRLSLAGAQDKLPVRLGEGGDVLLPFGDAASTHILKLPSRDDANLVENELLCLELARRVGLRVVRGTLLPTGSRAALLTTRYDREPTERTGAPAPDPPRAWLVALPAVRRRHQEDLAQALGCSRHRKYEEHGGPSLADCARVIREDGLQPGLDLRALIRWVAFCLCIGNRDNHAKNLSRLLHETTGRWELAPFYDLVNTTSYRRLAPTLAFHLDGEALASHLSRRSWERWAGELGVAPRLVLREVREMANGVADTLPTACQSVADVLGDDARLVQFARAIDKCARSTRQSLQ